MLLLQTYQKVLLQVTDQFFANGSIGHSDFQSTPMQPPYMRFGRNTLTSQLFPDLIQFPAGRLFCQPLSANQPGKHLAKS
jgi:hypothetical protein